MLKHDETTTMATAPRKWTAEELNTALENLTAMGYADVADMLGLAGTFPDEPFYLDYDCHTARITSYGRRMKKLREEMSA